MDLKNTLKAIKLNESTISMVLGIVVIVTVGVLVINYFRGLEAGQTIPSAQTENLSLPTTHIVQKGEDLWKISEKYYETGYNWIDIANSNNIDDPNQLEEGQELIIPDTEPVLVKDESTDTATAPDEVFTETGETNVHTVKKGETLWSISETYYGSGFDWEKIKISNNLTSETVEIGQELTIPNADVLLDKSDDSIQGSTYKIQKGDSLWKIAVRAYGDGYRWSDIAKANNLSDPNIIHIDNDLTLPR